MNENNIRKTTIVAQLLIVFGLFLLAASITLFAIDIPKPSYWIWITTSLLVLGLSLTLTGLQLISNVLRILSSVVFQLQNSQLTPQKDIEYYNAY